LAKVSPTEVEHPGNGTSVSDPILCVCEAHRRDRSELATASHGVTREGIVADQAGLERPVQSFVDQSNPQASDEFGTEGSALWPPAEQWEPPRTVDATIIFGAILNAEGEIHREVFVYWLALTLPTGQSIESV
jgi:hypothetical protein